MVKNISTDNPKTRTITLESGVVLKIHKVPTMLFGDITRRYPRPKPSKWLNPDTGKEEDNIDDPNFAEALSGWNVDIAMAMVDNMIIMGTEVQEIPAGIAKIEDTDWSDRLEAGGFVITNKAKRYLAWVKYIACSDSDDDIALLTEEVGKQAGVSEKDVGETVNRFRDSVGR